jgi:hypothetical protein
LSQCSAGPNDHQKGDPQNLNLHKQAVEKQLSMLRLGSA